MGKLFGTDGVRGVANVELTCELAIAIGRAVATIFEGESGRKRFLIGKDPRLSSDMLEGALAAGICSMGDDVTLVGVVPTPAVAFLTRQAGFDGGIMISASHNSFEFNGIKIFGGDGYKLPDEREDEVERLIFENGLTSLCKTHGNIGRVLRDDTLVQGYIRHIKNTIDGDLSGLHLAIDCSNGSASSTARGIFEGLGATCTFLNDNPDGTNINQNCGSVHVENIAKFVRGKGLDAGISFDGDADRCLAVDESGQILDGDHIMAICTKDLQTRQSLNGEAVVGTVMTNMGFEKFCKENALRFVAAKVGDRYVLEGMRSSGCNFGGEQSGHIIFLDFSTTGDGQLTAVQLLAAVKRSSQPLSSLRGLLQKFPQVLINVKISPENRQNFEQDADLQVAIEKVSKNLCKEGTREGRVLVRASGTEPLVRVMLEGRCSEKIQGFAQELVDLIREKFG